jgi:cobalt-precorrin 5A hydrolase
MIVAGIGCRAGTGLGTLTALLGALHFDAVASLSIRRNEAGALAQSTGKPLILHDSLTGVITPTQSPRILALHGTGSVAEAAALAALAPGARLILPRIQSTDGSATLAIAEGDPR